MKISGHTILLVEDDPNDVLLMQRAFRKANLTNPLPVARDLVNSLASYWLAVNKKSDLQDEAEPVRGMPCAQTQPA